MTNDEAIERLILRIKERSELLRERRKLPLREKLGTKYPVRVEVTMAKTLERVRGAIVDSLDDVTSNEERLMLAFYYATALLLELDIERHLAETAPHGPPDA